MKNKFSYISIAVILVLSVIIIVVSPLIYPSRYLSDRLHKNLDYEIAKVIEVKGEVLKPDPKLSTVDIGYQDIKIEILNGKYAGQKFDIRNGVSRIYNIKVKPGMEVVAGIYTDKGQISQVAIYSHKRSQVIYWLVAIFCIVIVAVGRLKGFKSLVALFFTGITVIFLMIPLIFRGVNPILAAIITAILTTSAMMLLIGDSKEKIYAATLGAVLGVIAAGLISYIAGELAHLSGLTMENAENIMYIAENSSMKVQGLMFASILIASLGAIMDMSMSIASAIFEVHGANPKQSQKNLFQSGMNIGRDVIGTMANTLILAFAGSSLTLLILLIAADMPYAQLSNLDVITTELIQGLSGSIGIVLTVPITSFITAMIIKQGRIKNIKFRK